MKKLKILSVGCGVSKDNKLGIEEGSFYQPDSFSEYDVLIIDPTDMDILLIRPDKNILKYHAIKTATLKET